MNIVYEQGQVTRTPPTPRLGLTRKTRAPGVGVASTWFIPALPTVFITRQRVSGLYMGFPTYAREHRHRQVGVVAA